MYLFMLYMDIWIPCVVMNLNYPLCKLWNPYIHLTFKTLSLQFFIRHALEMCKFLPRTSLWGQIIRENWLNPWQKVWTCLVVQFSYGSLVSVFIHSFNTRTIFMQYLQRNKYLQITRREGKLVCKLYWYPKFYNHVILFVKKILDTFIEFWFVGSINNFNLPKVNHINIIWDVYKFFVQILSLKIARKLNILLG